MNDFEKGRVSGLREAVELADALATKAEADENRYGKGMRRMATRIANGLEERIHAAELADLRAGNLGLSAPDVAWAGITRQADGSVGG